MRAEELPRGGGGKILRKEQLDIITYSTTTALLCVVLPSMAGNILPIALSERPANTLFFEPLQPEPIESPKSTQWFQPLLSKQINRRRGGVPSSPTFGPISSGKFNSSECRTKFLRLVVWCGSRRSIASHLGVRAVGAAPFPSVYV